MATYFFPSCKATAQFRQASGDARAYVREKLGAGPAGCCRPNHAKLAAGDTAVVVCSNCALIAGENTDARIEFLWEVIDRDPGFPYPDYGGERITLQDCWIAFDRPAASGLALLSRCACAETPCNLRPRPIGRRGRVSAFGPRA